MSEATTSPHSAPERLRRWRLVLGSGEADGVSAGEGGGTSASRLKTGAWTTP